MRSGPGSRGAAGHPRGHARVRPRETGRARQAPRPPRTKIVPRLGSSPTQHGGPLPLSTLILPRILCESPLITLTWIKSPTASARERSHCYDFPRGSTGCPGASRAFAEANLVASRPSRVSNGAMRGGGTRLVERAFDRAGRPRVMPAPASALIMAGGFGLPAGDGRHERGADQARSGRARAGIGPAPDRAGRASRTIGGSGAFYPISKYLFITI